jgi:putative DNA primase/helicase
LQSLTNDNGYAKIGNKLVNYASEINGKLKQIFLNKWQWRTIEARLPYGEPFHLY